MLIHAKKMLTLNVVALVMVAILLPMSSLAATSPSVSVLGILKSDLRAPAKIAIDRDGNIFVTDQRIRGVVKFNTYGVQQQIIPTNSEPIGIAFALDGTLLVCQNSFVVRYDATTGQEIGRLVGGQLQLPAAIAVDDVTGYIYVADSRADQVEIYTASGEYVKAFGKGARLDASGAYVVNPLGKLCLPLGISFEKASRQVAVADAFNNRVQFFDVDGNFVKSFGDPIPTTIGTAIGQMQFLSPAAIAFEYSKDPVPVLNRIYVVDSYTANVQVFNPGSSTIPVSALSIAGRTTNNINIYTWPSDGSLKLPNDAIFDEKNSRLLVANGTGNITIYGIDGGTNPVYSDMIPPELTVNPVPAEITVNTLTISGTVEAGCSVRILAGSSALVGAVAYDGLSWSVVVDALAAGNNSFTVTAKDSAGNNSAPQAFDVSYMLPAPGVTVSAVPTLTNSGELVLSGTVEDGATVTVANETMLSSGVALVVGASWTHKITLTEGTNRIAITAQKPLSLKATKALTIVMDSVPPALEVSALSDGSTTSNPIQNVTGNAPDATAVIILLNTVPVEGTFVDGSFSALVPLQNGSNEVTVEARDIAGNVTADSRIIFLDATKPQITIASPMDNSFTNNANIEITGSVDEVATVVVAGVPAIVDNNNNWIANIVLSTGLNTLEVSATDLYGNTSTIKRSIDLDTVKPVLAITYPVQDIVVNRPSETITGTVDDYSTVTYSINNRTVSVPVEAGNFTFKIDFQNEGLYPVIVAATDYAGNTTTAIRTLGYDATPPLLTLDAEKWQAHALGGEIIGTVDPGSAVVIKGIFVKEGIETTTITANVVGDKWRADLKGFSFNQNRLSVEASDAAGNITVKVVGNSSSDKK